MLLSEAGCLFAANLVGAALVGFEAAQDALEAVTIKIDQAELFQRSFESVELLEPLVGATNGVGYAFVQLAVPLDRSAVVKDNSSFDDAVRILGIESTGVKLIVKRLTFLLLSGSQGSELGQLSKTGCFSFGFVADKNMATNAMS